jgi:hypothetical protein
MSPSSLAVTFAWAVPPLIGALIGFATARIAARLFLKRAFARNRIQEFVQEALRRLVATPSFLHETRQSIAKAVSTACALRMSDVLVKLKAKPFLVDTILPGLARTETRTAFARAAGEAVGEREQSLLSEPLLENVSGILGQQLPVVVERLIEWMESPQMRETMAARGRELLPQILEKLNVMQRFLLSAGQFDKRLDEKMAEIVEATLQSLERVLREPTQQHAMRDRILLAVRDWRDGKTAKTDTAVLVTQLVQGYFEGLEHLGAREGVYQSLEGFLTSGGQSLGAFLRRHAGLSEPEVADSLANSILGWLSRSQTAALLSSRIATNGEQFFVPLQTRLPAMAAAFGAALGLALGLVEDLIRVIGLG